MKKREFKIFFFFYVWEKKVEEILLEEFYNDFRGVCWKVFVELYWWWMWMGMIEEGKRLKGVLNVVVVVGKCWGGYVVN